MNQQGQVFSLDAVFSLLLAMLALGLILGITDTTAYDLKEQELWNELRTVGRITGNVLVASPDIGCDVQNRAGENLYQITHCIDMLKDIDSILNTTLDGFDYRLEINGNVFGKVIPEAASNVYAENRKILTSNGPVEKRSWRSLTETEITLSVWRN